MIVPNISFGPRHAYKLVLVSLLAIVFGLNSASAYAAKCVGIAVIPVADPSGNTNTTACLIEFGQDIFPAGDSHNPSLPSHVCHERREEIFAVNSIFIGSWGASGAGTPTTCLDSDTSNKKCAMCVASHNPTCPAGEVLLSGTKFCINKSDEVVREREYGESCQPHSANPIYYGSGNKLIQATDFRGEGPMPLEWQRTYNSLEGVWRHNYNRHLTIVHDQHVQVVRGDGKRLDFYLTDSNEWVALSDTTTRLSYDDVALTWTVTTPNDVTEVYNSDLRLITMTNRAGQTITLSYVSGRLDTVTSFTGRTITANYDGGGRLASILVPGGYSYNYAYDANGMLSTVTYPDDTPTISTDNPVLTYHYEDANFSNLVTGITDERGIRYANYAYDVERRGTLSELSGGVERTSVVYGTNTAAVTNPLGRTSDYTFVIDNAARKVTQVNGQPTTLCGATVSNQTYDANGFVDTRTDENGNVTDYTYDARGLVTAKTVGLGTPEAVTTNTTWHPTFRVPTQITKPGQTIDMTYDTEGRMLTRTVTDTQTQSIPYVTTGNTRTTTYTYNAFGLIETIDGPRTDVSDVMTYAYDANGQLTTTTNALGQITEIVSRDARGLPTLIRDVNNITTQLDYDARGNLVQSTVLHPTGNAITSFQYDAANLLIRVTAPNGSHLQYDYDDAQRLIGIENNLGERLEYTLDNAGNHIGEQTLDSASNVVKSMTSVYDELSRVRTITGANGQIETLSYDDNDNLTSSADGLSRTSSQSYDALDRLIDLTNPSTNTSGTTHDARDNVLTVSDFNGVTTTYIYDGLDNLIQESSPDMGTAIHVYDAAGNLVQSTDARGIVVQYAYDALNRITNTTYPASTAENVTYTYDQNTNGVGRLSQRVDESGTTNFVYDHRGNLLSETRVVGTVTIAQSYTYDLSDLMTSMTYPSGRVVSYVRDTLGRITSMSSQMPGEPVVSLVSGITYAPYGPALSWTSGNGISNARTLDQDYRISTVTISGSGGTLHDLNYGYDIVDNITNITDGVDASKTQSVTYDLEDRVSTANSHYGAHTYIYDVNGNRTQRVRIVDDGAGGTTTKTQNLTYALGTNRLETRNGKQVVQDASGRRISDKDGQKLIAYNHAGRRTTFTKDAQLLATYAYNAAGQRTHKIRHKDNGDKHKYFYYGVDGMWLGDFTQNPGGNTAYFDYVWLDGVPLVRLKRSFDSGGMFLSDKTTWLHADHLNTPRLGTDDAQTTVWRWDSDPFGVGGIDSDPDGDGTKHAIPLRFPGQYKDGEANIAYNYYRSYDQTTGRYTQTDPIGLAGGLNTYGYVHGNPLRYSDPRGLAAQVCLIPGVNVACGAAATAVAEAVGGLALLGGVLSIPGDSAEPQSCQIPSEDVDEAEDCEALYQVDTDTCSGITRVRGGRAGAVCHASAAERYSACLAGRPIPPLNTWAN